LYKCTRMCLPVAATVVSPLPSGLLPPTSDTASVMAPEIYAGPCARQIVSGRSLWWKYTTKKDKCSLKLIKFPSIKK
jgi:hypothetical protein